MGDKDHLAFDGKAHRECSEEEVFGYVTDLVDDPLTAGGFEKIASFLSDEMFTVYRREQNYIVELVLDGGTCTFVKVGGLADYLEYVRLYLNPLVAVYSTSNHAALADSFSGSLRD